MLIFIRFIFICVIVFLSKSPVLTDVSFVEVNIANISTDFTVSKKKNFDHIVVSEDAKLDNKCVGRVVDSTLKISDNPDPKATYRYVRVVKYPKTGDHNPDLEEAVKHDSLELDRSEQVGDDSNYLKTVEIHTFFDSVILLDRYAKDQNGNYVNFDFTQVDVDICQDITDTVEIDNYRYYKVPNYHTVGAIKCGATVLLDGLNVFYRTIQVHDRKVVVNTVPKFGIITDVTFDLGKQLKQVTTQATGRKLMTLRLDRVSSLYERMLSTCGNDCLFLDGCNEKTVLVNVQEAENVIYSNKNTLCISVKVEEFPEAKYVTIYDKPRNSNYYIVTILRRGATETSFTKHKKTPVEVDVTDVPRTKDAQYSGLLIGESLTPNARYRIKNVDYRIGNLYMGGNLLLGDADIIFNREIYTNEKGIMVFDQYYNGESNRYLFRPTGGDPKDPSTLQRAGKPLHLLPEYVVKVDLNNITANVTKYATVSGENLFVRTNSFVEKLGSLTYNTFMVCPNRFYVANQYMIMNDKEMKLYSVTRRGYGFLESFVKVDSFFQGEKTFVSKAKEVVTFDIMDFYTWINDMMMDSLTGFEIKFMGDYYMVGMRYKYLFGKMIGNIEVKGKVIAPLDSDLSSRELLLPTNTQSFFILRDCDTLDCWHRTYKETSANGYIGYEIQQKTSLPMDILKIYQNDQGQTVFTFDHFVVYKYGTVYNVRVLNDLEHKIGTIQFNGHDLLPDNDDVFTRMVNVSVVTQNNVDVNGASVLQAIAGDMTVTGLLRILEIEKWDKTTKLYSYQINQTQGFKASPVAKKALELDLEPLVRKDTNLNISARDEVFNYQINWTNRDDYELTKIKCSHFMNNQWVPSNLIENLKQFPVFVRLHKDDEYDTSRTISLAIENHHGLAKPKSGQLFTVETNADKKGILLKYSMRDKTSKHMRDHTVDSYHRRNFTSHRHTFQVDSVLAGSQTQVTQPPVPAGGYGGQGVTGAQTGQAATATRVPQGPTPAYAGQPGQLPSLGPGTGGQRGKTIKLDDSDDEKK